MTINLSDEMILTLRRAVALGLADYRSCFSRAEASGVDKGNVELLRQRIIDTQAALDMLDEMVGK